jgi:hypothetical protein
MFETPDAAQTWSAETEAVAAEDADPLDIPIPTASYRDRNQRQQKGPHSAGRLDETDSSEPTGSDREPHADDLTATESGGEPRHEGCDHNEPNGCGQGCQPGLKRREPERVGVLEVEAEQVHESVDRAGANENRHRGGHEDPIAQYRQVQHRDSNPPFHSYEREG